MMKRLVLVLALFALAGPFAGCRFAAPFLEDMGGCPCAGHGTGCDTKTKAILRQWGADARSGEQFIDQYFLNYDIHDPYRGDCVTGW